MSPRCLVVTGDLMGYSQLAGVIRSAGLEPVQVRGVPALQAASLEAVHAAVVELFDAHGGPDAVQAAVARGLPVVAVGPHVRQDLFQAAEQAGALDVLPHSAVATKLAPLLEKLAETAADHDLGPQP